MALETKFSLEELRTLRGLSVAAEPELRGQCWSPMLRPEAYCARRGCADPLLVFVDDAVAWYRHGESLVRVELTPLRCISELDALALTYWLDAIHAQEAAAR